MTDDELKILAVDIVDQKVFGSWMLPEAKLSLIPNIFLSYGVRGEEKLPDDTSCLYQYFDKALQRLPPLDGYPTFLYYQVLTHEDRERLVPMIERYKSMKQEFMNTR
jgi:hypothetical protein